jgi:hypothetical protein
MRDQSFRKLQQESNHRRSSFVREFWDFLRVSKKWWLLPIVVVLLAVGMLISLGGTAAAPFIYTLF